MVEVNTWVTAVFVGLIILQQLIGVMIAIRFRFDGWGLLTGYGLASIAALLFRNFWLGIAAQLVA